MWKELLEQWRNSAAVHVLLQGVTVLDLEALSAALCDSLQRLVQLAGGWSTGLVMRRQAYASNEMRGVRRQLTLLQKLEDSLQHTPSTPGCSPWLRG